MRLFRSLSIFRWVFTSLVLSVMASCASRQPQEPSPAADPSDAVVQVYFSEYADPLSVPKCEGRILPLKYRLLEVNYVALRSLLLAPDPTSLIDTIVLAIPMPDGSLEEFSIYPSQTMAPALAIKYPEIRTYAGKSINSPGDQIRLEITPLGFTSMVTSTRGTMMIDPFCKGDSVHVIVYNRNDLPPDAKQPFEGK